jgi:hypothetical protein
MIARHGPNRPWAKSPLPIENAAPDDPRSSAHLENNFPSGPTKSRGAFVGPEERSVNVIPFPASRPSRNVVHPLMRTDYMTRPVDPRPALRRAAIAKYWLRRMADSGGEPA